MTITVSTPFLPAATLSSDYKYQLISEGGTAPYSYAIISGSMPLGLVMDGSGLISGRATNIGTSSVVIEISDNTVPGPLTTLQTFQLTVLDLIDLSTLTVDQNQFVQQLQQALSKSGVWSTGITTQTSQTLIELISAIGTFTTAKINRIKEDAFPETAQSDSAILAIANMQGLRLARRMPASVPVTLVSGVDVSISPYTQFSGGGFSWFNSEPIVLKPNVPKTAMLKEGKVNVIQITGLGTDLQTWVSTDTNFTVSDQDVVVYLNSTPLTKTFGGLWNYPQSVGSSKAYADRTLSDGRLLLQFGSSGYGAIPTTNDVVTIVYATTQGAALNSAVVNGGSITASGYTSVIAMFVGNPSGGADKKNTVAYKNFSAGTFGSFSSAVTKSQYQSMVNNYPGIVDAVTQAQREINPAALAWMNVIRVSALTSSTWTQSQINEFLDYIQSVTMFSTKFVWQAPVPVPVTIDLSVFCYNSVANTATVTELVKSAITKLLTPRPGLIGTNFYQSDLMEAAMNAAPNQISYVVVNAPTQPMIVSAPSSPRIEYTIVNSGGSLNPQVYNYSVSVDAPTPNENLVGLIDAVAISSSHWTNWPNATAVGQYWIVRTAGYVQNPVTGGNTTQVYVGDQLLATSIGNTDNNFTVIRAAVNGVIDVGVPSKWVSPQVTVGGSRIVLDWSADKIDNALTYYVWGRKGGEVGVIATVPGSITSITDPGTFIPAVVPVSAYSETLLRYNQLKDLTVNTYYSSRQNSALFPIRDTLQ